MSQILHKEQSGLKEYSASYMKNMRKFYENWQILDPISSIETDNLNSAIAIIELQNTSNLPIRALDKLIKSDAYEQALSAIK